jgi:fructose-specific phosphotransferase system IIC component
VSAPQPESVVAATPTLRSISRSALVVAGATGVVVRLFRAVVLTQQSFESWPVFLISLVLGVVLLCGMLTLYLSNYPIRRWLRPWLTFLAIEWAAEMLVSTVLIALRAEPLGSGLATWGDWLTIAGQTLLERVLVLGSYAGLLAVAMWLVTRRSRIDG